MAEITGSYTPDNIALAILGVWATLETQVRQWYPVWQELADYIQPRKSNISFIRTPGQRQTDKLFDSTAPHAMELLAASMQGSLTSGSQRWLGLRLLDVEYGKDNEIQKWLDTVSEKIYDTLRESNFNSESHELYQDISVFGTGLIYCDEKMPTMNSPFGGIRFSAIHPGSFAIDEDEDGYVNLVYRKISMTSRAAEAAFTKAKLGSKCAADLEKGGTGSFDFLHAVYPRTDATTTKPKGGGKDMPFCSYWVDMADQICVREGGYREFPFMCPRWAKTSGEIYGRGPGYVALPDIKTLNKAVELKLRAWAKVINPPIKVRDEGVIGTVKLTPAGLTHVRDMDAVQVLDLGGRFDVADMEEDKIRGAIRRIFFSDQLQLQEGPQMTAYEVQVRYELMQRILGPTLGRIEVEFLEPLVVRVFWILFRRGVLPPMPPKLATYWQSGGRTVVQYEGPLARAQRLQESVSVQRFFQIALPIEASHPEAMDIVDMDEVIKLHALSVGVPAGVLRTDRAIAEIRAAREQARAEMAAQQQMATMAQAAGQAAPALKALTEGAQAGILPASGAVGTLEGGT